MSEKIQVVAALVWQNGKFLICQRAETKMRGLQWEFVGGKVERGETFQQALIRECEEEIGVKVRPGQVFAETDYAYNDMVIHLTLFDAEIADGVPRLKEHADMKWIGPEEIPQYRFSDADSLFLSKISKTVRNNL